MTVLEGVYILRNKTTGENVGVFARFEWAWKHKLEQDTPDNYDVESWAITVPAGEPEENHR